MADDTRANSNIEAEATTAVAQLVTTLFTSADDFNRQLETSEGLSHSYVRRWLQRWGEIHPLGADRPIPLHRIYVQVRAVPRTFLQRFASIEDLEASFLGSASRGFFGLSEEEQHHYAAQSGMRIANSYSHLNILGAPGAGKSTFLRRVGLEALLPQPSRQERIPSGLESEYHYQLLPVLLELRSLRSRPCATPEDLVELIKEELTNAGFIEVQDLVISTLNAGKFLVLLDGVDEIPTQDLARSVKAIRDFIARYPKCRYIISCRTAFYKDWFEGFRDFVLADFNNTQIEAFADNWFARKEEREANVASGFVKLLQSPDHRATRELAGSPLLLTFLCLVYRKTQQFPANRAQVYQKAVRIFLEEWNAHKLIHHDRLYQDLTPELELELLKDIAGPSFIEARLFFTGDELRREIREFFRRELNAPHTLSANDVLTAIAVQQGLFVERAQDVWTFSHLTIQEYLAAAWILEEGQANELILQHAHDGRWREVFLLMSGLTRADGVLAVLGDKVEATVISRPTIATLFNILNDAAEEAWRLACSDPQHGQLIGCGLVSAQLMLRGVGLFLGRITNAPTEPAGFSIGLAGESMLAINAALRLPYEPELRNALHRSRGKIPDADLNLALDLDVARFFSVKTTECISSAVFDVLRNGEADSLVTHLQLCKLVCDCKRAAMRLSVQAWELACSRMLRAADR
jgi:hypothetical protein